MLGKAEKLSGPGSRVATDRKIPSLEDLATPFSSLDKLKKAAATRLKLQQDQDKRRQAVVEPTSSVSGTPNTPKTTITSAGTSQNPSAVRGTTPVPKRKWVTVPIRRGKKLEIRTKTPATRHTMASSFYAGLAEWPEEKDVCLPTGTPTPPVADTVYLTAETFTKPVEVSQTLATEKNFVACPFIETT
uniref:Uncharacterized protein n=1 Tax=Peronospora matthiolae TaxID=2874970 RepID=A0AAV1U5P0_9STRA